MKPDPELSSTALYEAASVWFTRRQAGEDWSVRAEADFQAWLKADPSHRQAFQEIAEVWEAFDHVPRPMHGNVKRHSAPRYGNPSPLAGKAATAGSGRHPVRGLRRGFGSLGGSVIMALSLCMSAGIGVWYWHGNTPQFSAYIQTAHGEQREVPLPDGTVLTVNMESRLEINLYPRRREVVLAQGEAFFNVAPDSDGAAFLVRTDNTQVRVVGTAFNVRTGARAHYVRVQEGLVEVSSRGEGDYSEMLRAGEALEVDAVTGIQQRLSSTPEAAGSWRNGQLMFRNATLAEVADELSGYLNQPIELLGSGVRDYRLSGFASTKAPEDFLDALPQLLPVEVRHSSKSGYRIVSEN